MKPLLSIVVPTKNRYIYLKYLIELIVSFNSDEIELIIQDNSDNNEEIIQYLNDKSYSIVKYFHRTNKLSMAGNSDAAILNSTGEYVCFIGDDDGVCRNILDCVKWMKQNGIEAVRSRRTGFIWSDSTVISNKINNKSACVIYDLPIPEYRLLNPIEELDKILKKGFQSIDFIPMLYHGIVKRSVLDKVYAVGSTFFPGGSPDISNGVSLCFFTKKVVFVNFPIIISGTSRMTGGGINQKKGRSVPLEKVDFINKSVIDQWEIDLPRIWAGKIAWPESGIKALRYVGKEEYIEKLNRNYMYAAFAVYFSHYYKVAYQYAPNKLYFLWFMFVILFSNGVRVLKNKIESFFLRDRYVGRFIKRNILNIIQAESFLTNNVSYFNFNELKQLS